VGGFEITQRQQAMVTAVVATIHITNTNHYSLSLDRGSLVTQPLVDFIATCPWAHPWTSTGSLRRDR
jgi:hypothetical protein